MSALIPFLALASTVALLVTTAYFLMGGLPLLILQHDTPLDSRFIRRFFEIYYRAAMVTAAGAGLGYLLWGKPAFAAGCAGVLALVAALRARVLPAMGQLGAQIASSEASALQRFRRVHGAALAANAVQLVFLVWGLTRLSL